MKISLIYWLLIKLVPIEVFSAVPPRNTVNLSLLCQVSKELIVWACECLHRQCKHNTPWPHVLQKGQHVPKSPNVTLVLGIPESLLKNPAVKPAHSWRRERPDLYFKCEYLEGFRKALRITNKTLWFGQNCCLYEYAVEIKHKVKNSRKNHTKLVCDSFFFIGISMQL